MRHDQLLVDLAPSNNLQKPLTPCSFKAWKTLAQKNSLAQQVYTEQNYKREARPSLRREMYRTIIFGYDTAMPNSLHLHASFGSG
jgi:hypothetical protein